MQPRWIEQLLQEFIIPRRWEYTDCRFYVRSDGGRWVCDMNRLANTCIFHCLKPRRSDKIWGLRHSWSKPQKGFSLPTNTTTTIDSPTSHCEVKGQRRLKCSEVFWETTGWSATQWEFLSLSSPGARRRAATSPGRTFLHLVMFV